MIDIGLRSDCRTHGGRGERQIFDTVARWRVACLQVLDKRFPIRRGPNRNASANDRICPGDHGAHYVQTRSGVCAELTGLILR
jgi:hypothetical protein